ncbi:macrophage metalloelastase-like [Chironomus tepperi]|uniref:macrophage metalloelastase-like n=1 Tax=Chironomus tepperi TaxID=113505 RepID=UPI00391F9E64
MKNKFLKSTVILNLTLILKISCVPISDYKEVIEYLQNFDYLTQDDRTSLNYKIDNKEDVKNDKRLKRALENLQINGNIPITGKYDKSTAMLIDTPRCGVSDKNIIGKRHKRYTLMSSKWPSTTITYRFDHKNKAPFVDEQVNIRRRLREAFNVWEKDTIMKFIEIEEGTADIMISFEHPKHTQIDPYVFGTQTLGHAFQPGKNIGGDAHFNERIKWDFNVQYASKPEDGKISFFAVALHELGHSLGLGHTRDTEAVMYEFYSRSTSTLAEDDIRGMQHIYGVPPNRKYTPDQKVKDEEEMPVWRKDPILPDKCNTSYDAISLIDGEIIGFRRKYMFSSTKNATEIRTRWQGLPLNLKSVDAVFQTSDRRVLFFIGQDLYVMNGNKQQKSYKLKDIGMDDSIKKIDAIFRNSLNKQVYIFFDNSYYKFDEHKMMVTGTKSRITKAFRDVFDIDTGFTSKDGKTYFIKNEYSYEFDNENWYLRRMKPELTANLFMDCNLPTENIIDRFSVNDDYIDDENEFIPEAPNCQDNPEIPCNDPGSGSVKRSYTVTLFIIVGSSFFV